MSTRDQEIRIQPGKIPTTPIIWPSIQHVHNQVQQTKGSAKPQTANVLPTTQPSLPSVAPRTTPQHVSRLRVVTKNVGNQKQVTVKFTHPGGDQYFSGANVYLQRAGQQPTLVASGAKSPLTFTAPKSAAPHAIFVTSSGNWGETAVTSSPGSHVRLV